MKKNGFTLAEVLITMGIIGIIAAITMPTVMMDSKYKQLGVKLSKFYSSLYNVTKEYTAYNGEFGSNAELLTHLNKSFDFKYIKDNYSSLGESLIESNYPPNINQFEGDSYGVLADNTRIAVQDRTYFNHVSYNIPDNYNNVQKYGTPFARIYFDPSVKGLPSGAQQIFQFVVTTKGVVIPEDSCTQAIFRNNWIVDSSWFISGRNCYYTEIKEPWQDKQEYDPYPSNPPTSNS